MFGRGGYVSFGGRSESEAWGVNFSVVTHAGRGHCSGTFSVRRMLVDLAHKLGYLMPVSAETGAVEKADIADRLLCFVCLQQVSLGKGSMMLVCWAVADAHSLVCNRRPSMHASQSSSRQGMEAALLWRTTYKRYTR